MKRATIDFEQPRVWQPQSRTQRLQALETKIHTLLDAASLDDRLHVTPGISIRLDRPGESTPEVLTVTTLISTELRPAVAKYLGRPSAPPRREFPDDLTWYEARKEWWKDRAELIDGWLNEAATLLTAAGIKYIERTQRGLRTDLVVKL